ncbi:MAG: hypothetical protein NC300_11440 [Bacteroidales bacterium]|nr:hypothetical protein [Clostridium sp.]MCM1204745.1 hypothetical protein [Bacteroidales bacterium]
MNDKTITIYNYHRRDKTEAWYRTVISGVEYRYITEKTVNSSGTVIRTPVLTVVIPVEADAGGKDYIDYVEYLKLSAEEVKDFWTVNPKDNSDVIICGICEKEIADGYRISELKKDFLKAGVIAGLNDNTEGEFLKHYKVVCK